jgi:hypothetical protein
MLVDPAEDARSLVAISLRVSFRIKFPLDKAGYTGASSAKTDIAGQLNVQVKSGAFSSAVNALAAQQNPGVVVPAMAVSDIEESEGDGVTVIEESSAPTFAPTGSPTREPRQEYTLAFCSGIIVLSGLMLVLLGSKWDTDEISSPKPEHNPDFEQLDSPECAARVVMDALPDISRGSAPACVRCVCAPPLADGAVLPAAQVAQLSLGPTAFAVHASAAVPVLPAAARPVCKRCPSPGLCVVGG